MPEINEKLSPDEMREYGKDSLDAISQTFGDVLILTSAGAITRGVLGASGKALSQHELYLLRKAAEEHFEYLVSTPGSKKGPVLSVILDRQTGEVFWGTNSGIPENLHPMLDQRLLEYREWIRSTGFRPKRSIGAPGAHSEFNALNKALWQREKTLGRQIRRWEEADDFVITNVRLRGSSVSLPIPRCDHCQALTRGIVTLSDKAGKGIKIRLRTGGK